MASPEITNYITQNLNLGYDINSIKNSLAQSGYTVPQINAAIDYVSAQNHHQGNTTKKWSQTTTSNSTSHTKPLLFIAGLLIFAVGIGLFVIFANSGSDDPYERPYQPQQPAGQYEEPTQTQRETIPDDNTPVVIDQPPKPEIKEPTRTITKLSRLEIDETVSEIAATQPEKAIELCAQIITRAGTFTCITKVAFESQDETYCASISDVSAKDTCYINFAINEIGTEDICQKIANEYKKRSCFDLYDTLEELKKVESLPVPTVAEQEALALQLDAPSQELIDDASTTNAFGSDDETIIEDDVAI